MPSASDLTESALEVLAARERAWMGRSRIISLKTLRRLVAEVQRRRKCPLCDGDGELDDGAGVDDSSYTCPACEGSGKALDTVRLQAMVDRYNRLEGDAMVLDHNLKEAEKKLAIASRFLKMACDPVRRGGDGIWDEPGTAYSIRDDGKYWLLEDGIIGVGTTMPEAHEDVDRQMEIRGVTEVRVP